MVRRIKKIIMAISLFVISISNNVFAKSDSEITALYGIPKDQVLYGPPRRLFKS